MAYRKRLKKVTKSKVIIFKLEEKVHHDFHRFCFMEGRVPSRFLRNLVVQYVMVCRKHYKEIEADFDTSV